MQKIQVMNCDQMPDETAEPGWISDRMMRERTPMLPRGSRQAELHPKLRGSPTPFAEWNRHQLDTRNARPVRYSWERIIGENDEFDPTWCPNNCIEQMERCRLRSGRLESA